MNVANPTFQESISSLDQAVAHAVKFFHTADELLRDGEQTAREVISHLVYWHREYVLILEAIAAGEAPLLLSQPLRFSNALSAVEFKNVPLPQLADQLGELQVKLSRVLNMIPDLNADFPVKTGLKFCSIAERVPPIEAHIRGHTQRLELVQRKTSVRQTG